MKEKREISRNQQAKSNKPFTYFAKADELDVENTMKHIHSLYDSERQLIVPSWIDENGDLHIFPEEYVYYPNKPENIEKAKQFKNKFLELIKNNPNLYVTMVDCHIV